MGNPDDLKRPSENSVQDKFNSYGKPDTFVPEDPYAYPSTKKDKDPYDYKPYDDTKKDKDPYDYKPYDDYKKDKDSYDSYEEKVKKADPYAYPSTKKDTDKKVDPYAYPSYDDRDKKADSYEDYKPYDDDKRKKNDSFDYNYDDKKDKKVDDTYDYKPYDDTIEENIKPYIEDEKPSFEPLKKTVPVSQARPEKRKAYDSGSDEKPVKNIEFGKYDSFSQQNFRSKGQPEEVVKENMPTTKPTVFDRKESFDYEERPVKNFNERPVNNFVESKNASYVAPFKEQDFEKDLMIVTLKMIISNQKNKIEILEDDKRDMNKLLFEKDTNLRLLEDKVDDLETMGKLNDFGGNNDKVNVQQLDDRLKNIDDYLDGIKHDPEQSRMIDEIIKKNQDYSNLSTENAKAMDKLKSNIGNLKSTLNNLNIGD